MTATDDARARAEHERTAEQVVETGETEVHHAHRDVSGGWLRPAVFGVNDGLVSNFALVAGVAGASAESGPVVVAGLVGLVGGALSMASGEYVSVASERESVLAEVEKERRELEVNGDAEQAELAGSFRARGVDADLADRVAEQIHARPREALRFHVRDELGLDPDDIPSHPWTAAWSSLLCFSVGALVPLLPYLLGLDSVLLAGALSAVALVLVGVLTAQVTSRGRVFTAGRQLLIGVGAAVVTYGLGDLVGARF